MTPWQVLASCVGVIIGNALSLLPPIAFDHDKVPAGYLWSAARRASPNLLAVSAVELLIALIPAILLGPWHVGSGGYMSIILVGGLCGFVVGLYSYLGEKAYIDTVDSSNTLNRGMRFLRASVAKYRSFRRAIQYLIEKDNEAWQERQPPWRFDGGARVIGRRIRIIFAKKKLEISTARQDPKFMFLDVNVDPGQLFYPLVRHVGRLELMRLLSSHPTSPWPRMDWNGTERRRFAGLTFRDRKESSSWPIRRSDDPQLIAEICQGTACGEPPILLRAQEYIVRNVAGLAASNGTYDAIPWKKTKSPGIRWLPIQVDAIGRGAETDSIVMIQMDPGCPYPPHEHLGEEDVLILSGGYRDDRGEYRAGQFVRNPRGSSHEPIALGDPTLSIGPGNEACTIFAIARGGTRLLRAEDELDAVDERKGTPQQATSDGSRGLDVSMNSLTDPEACRLNKIVRWKEPETTDYLIEITRLGDEEEQSILERVQRFGICQIRWGASRPEPLRLRVIENGIGQASESQNSFLGKIKQIEPKANVEANTGDSAKDLAPHVDGTQHDRTPALLAFQYELGPEAGGHSTFVDLAQVLSELPTERFESVIRTLSKENCARFEKSGLTYEGPIVTSVCGGRSLAFRLRFDSVVTIHPECRDAFEDLRGLVEKASRMVFKPREGDIVIFDNWRLLHGRLEVIGRLKRLHDRMWIQRLHARHESRFLLGVRPITPALMADVQAANGLKGR